MVTGRHLGLRVTFSILSEQQYKSAQSLGNSLRIAKREVWIPVKSRWEFRPEFVMHLLRERLHHLTSSVGLVSRLCAVNSREGREVLSSEQRPDWPWVSASLLFAVIRRLSWMAKAAEA
jgi:hypothetical protein